MVPDLEFLAKVGRGEIVARGEARHGSDVWDVVGGTLKLRLHEEAGFVEPFVTARWAGYTATMRTAGVPARLTDAGRALLAEADPEQATEALNP